MPKDTFLILRALRKHWTICVLLIVQIALACAILGNGLNLVSQRYSLQRIPTGLHEESLIVLDVEALQGGLSEAQRDDVLAEIRLLPGVGSVAYVNALPFSGGGGTFSLSHEINGLARDRNVAIYFGSVGFLDTLGVQILSGRGFLPADVGRPDENPLASVSSIVLSETLSTRLSAPVGSLLKVAGRSVTVVGISADVLPPKLVSAEDAGNTAFIASPPGGAVSSQIVVSASPQVVPSLMPKVAEAATRATPKTLVWSTTSFDELRMSYFKLDRTVIRLIFGLGILLSLVVAGGVAGLSSYWIIRRHKQVAIRRALGASRRDIAWYFHLENLFIASTGAILGFIGAVALSVVLTDWLTLPSMPIAPLSLGALAMIAIGQMAIVLPVRRALSVHPAVLKTC